MLTTAILLSTTIVVIVDALSKPLKQRWPDTDFWWLFYVSFILGSAVGWFSEADLFSEYVPNIIVARILTAALIGGGPTLIHDLFSSGVKALNSITAKNWSIATLPDGIELSQKQKKDVSDALVEGSMPT